MTDANAGKYHKLYKREFELARKLLTDDGGTLEWGIHDYEAFVYRKPGVHLVFYPHRTSARNYHIRVRSNGSNYGDEADRLMKLLDEGSGFNCTFTHNRHPLRSLRGSA
ncbi:MAG TPA: hypothetical protein VGH91_04755 [Gammaproteobacteria bacterium]